MGQKNVFSSRVGGTGRIHDMQQILLRSRRPAVLCNRTSLETADPCFKAPDFKELRLTHDTFTPLQEGVNACW